MKAWVEIVDEDVVLVKVCFDDCLLVCVNGHIGRLVR